MPAEHQYNQYNDEPFTAQSEWYPYDCCACECKMWVEDIIIDGFPPDGPGHCPIIICPKCGKDFVRDTSEHIIKSTNDPNVSL